MQLTETPWLYTSNTTIIYILLHTNLCKKPTAPFDWHVNNKQFMIYKTNIHCHHITANISHYRSIIMNRWWIVSSLEKNIHSVCKILEYWRVFISKYMFAIKYAVWCVFQAILSYTQQATEKFWSEKSSIQEQSGNLLSSFLSRIIFTILGRWNFVSIIFLPPPLPPQQTIWPHVLLTEGDASSLLDWGLCEMKPVK